MFVKFWKIPDIMWSSFLQKQQFLPIKFFPLPMKVLVRPIVTWNGTQNELILKGTLRKLFACGAYFYENLQFRNFWSPPFSRISRECHQTSEQALMENPGRSRKEIWLNFRRQNSFFFFFLLNVFKAITWVTNGLKRYASSKPTCFFSD